MRKTILVAVLVGAGPLRMLGQSAPRLPSFEIASVRMHQEPIQRGGRRQRTISGNRLIFPHHTVLGLLAFAYNVKAYQISNWTSLDQTFYDVAAQAREGSTPTTEEFRLMMQSLLADRFKLKVRREIVETQVYAL